jgi:glycerol-3-phosphate dehydrogenase
VILKMRFSNEERRSWLGRAAQERFDLVVVGGGITGAGVAREAALRGHSVVLLERGDFASGTSSRSSKLIHGGVRYLAQGDIALVREAARERAVLRRLAPHLARPVRMVIPAGSRAGRMKLAAGLWTFDKLTGDPGERHEVLDRASALAAVPNLRREHLIGAVAFTEYVTHDARLTLETLKSAAAAGAAVANYAPVTGIRFCDGGVQLDAQDQETGEALEVRAKCLVNAAGPWFDEVRRMGDESADTAVQLTRGIHLVVRRERLAVDASVVLRSPDGRSTFVVPRDEYVYIGTTDTHYEGDAAEPGVADDDVAYLLESLAATFVDPPTAEDVIGTWSGVRPLLRQAGKSPSEISRRDEIHTGPGPVVAVAGGKLTTFRRMAERVVDKVEETAGLTPSRDPQSSNSPLIGGSAEQQREARSKAASTGDTKLDDRLWASYGLAAAELTATLASKNGAAESVGDLECLTRAEVDHMVEGEMVLHLDDMLRRRSYIGMLDTSQAVAAADSAAKALASRLGWNEDQVAHEVRTFSQPRVDELATATAVGSSSRSRAS